MYAVPLTSGSQNRGGGGGGGGGGRGGSGQVTGSDAVKGLGPLSLFIFTIIVSIHQYELYMDCHHEERIRYQCDISDYSCFMTF